MYHQKFRIKPKQKYQPNLSYGIRTVTFALCCFPVRMWGCWRSLLSCQPDFAVEQVSFALLECLFDKTTMCTCAALLALLFCQFVIVFPSLSTRAAAWFRGHRGSTSTGEGRTQAHLARGYRQIPFLSLCQVHVKGEQGWSTQNTHSSFIIRHSHLSNTP